MSMTGAAQALEGTRESGSWTLSDLGSADGLRPRWPSGPESGRLPAAGGGAEVIVLNPPASRLRQDSLRMSDTPGLENGRLDGVTRTATSGTPLRPAAPLRLTRRGRVVAGALLALAAIVVVGLLAAGPAGGLTGAGHQPARAGYRGMTQVVVRPGQSLWSIALAAEPSADPRIVIQQIMAANALGGQTVEAGQLLWVPRG